VRPVLQLLFVVSFAPNPLSALDDMLSNDFMRYAFVAGTSMSVLGGLVGYFVVLRQLAFAGEALSSLVEWVRQSPEDTVAACSDQSPFVLLPVRMETKFARLGDTAELRVRLFPDDIGIAPPLAAVSDTERDLGDGLAPAQALAAAGCALSLASDSHAVVAILEEARGVEYAERRARQAN